MYNYSITKIFYLFYYYSINCSIVLNYTMLLCYNKQCLTALEGDEKGPAMRAKRKKGDVEGQRELCKFVQ